MCLIPTAALCVLSLQSLTVDAQLQSKISGEPNHWYLHEGAWRRADGPVAEISISMQAEVSRSFSIPFGVGHRSVPSRNDRGEEYAFVTLRWRPFQ